MKRLHLTLFLTLTALPLAAGLIYAAAYSLGLTGMLREGFTLAHWQAVGTSSGFWRSAAFSLWVAMATVVVSVGTALLLVLGWRRDLAGSYLIYFPLALPALVTAFLVFQVFSQAGWLSRLAWHLGLSGGIESFPELTNDAWGLGIILAHSLMAIPFFAILFSNLYRSEQVDRLCEVAATLGAGRRASLLRVVLPVMLHRASGPIGLYGIFVLGSYEIPLVLGSQSPSMIAVLAIRKLQRFDLGEIPQAYAISLFFALAISAVVFWRKGKN